MTPIGFDEIWTGLVLPLARLTLFISLGLFVGNFIECRNWTRWAAKLAAPLARRARLKDISGASFSMAFVSGVAANTMLAEAHEQGKLSLRELLLSNLFNSLPTYFLHLPTIFFISASFIGPAAGVYVGLTAFSALLRTAFIVLMGRLLLPPLEHKGTLSPLPGQKDEKCSAIFNTWTRFKQRLPKILYFTVPIFTAFFLLRKWGVFQWLEQALAGNVGQISWLPPEALGIVVFHVAAEFTAGLAAAGALIQGGDLGTKEVVLALLLGNLLSSPMRALRHQFPYYAGIFKPRLAATMIFYSQGLRAASIALVGLLYFFWT